MDSRRNGTSVVVETAYITVAKTFRLKSSRPRNARRDNVGRGQGQIRLAVVGETEKQFSPYTSTKWYSSLPSLSGRCKRNENATFRPFAERRRPPPPCRICRNIGGTTERMFGDAFPNGRFEYATKPPGAFYANVRRGGDRAVFYGPGGRRYFEGRKNGVATCRGRCETFHVAEMFAPPSKNSRLIRP